MFNPGNEKSEPPGSSDQIYATSTSFYCYKNEKCVSGKRDCSQVVCICDEGEGCEDGDVWKYIYNF